MHQIAQDPIRVVLADDYPVTRAGIRTILDQASDIRVVGEAGDGKEAQRLTQELEPDILLLDLRMPGPKASDVAAWVRENCPETTTLVLTAHDVSTYLADMVDAEAAGFMTKDKAPEQLVNAIRRVARGERLFTPEQLDRARNWRWKVERKWKALTDRERDVLRLLVEGKTNRGIASALGIQKKTVDNHVGRILQKLRVDSRTEAAIWAVRQGFVRKDEDSEENQPSNGKGSAVE